MKSKVLSDITGLIGKTPLVRIDGVEESLFFAAKLEYLNPGGSIKDRVALNMILDAEKRGFIDDGTVIVEPTSGNTGISLALICAARGYRLILTLPESTLKEQIQQLITFGAEVIMTPEKEGMRGAIHRATEITETESNCFMPAQFNNPSNPEAHEKTTAPEIWDDTGGMVDVVVAGIGSGGTISGLAKGLKKKNKSIRFVGVEPASAPFISQGRSGRHRIPGIGPGFIPKVLNTEALDEILLVEDEEALQMARLIQKRDGIPAGLSSGAAAQAAQQLARRPENKNKLIVAIFPDSSAKYINMGLFT